MTWFTWRQFRTQAWFTVAALAALGLLLLVTGRSIAEAYADAAVATCRGDCSAAVTAFLNKAQAGTNGTVYTLSLVVMYLVPPLIGIFWGAPLIARELETGTHRVAWNQSVTRTRWLATKLAVTGAAALATVGLLSWAVTTWAHNIDSVTGDRITPQEYGARGIVPIGYALFALLLGVTIGMLIRRTVPAMATTLGIYLAAVISTQLWLRAHLTPANHTTRPLDVSTIDGLLINPDSGAMEVTAGGTPEGAWILSNRTTTATGEVFTGPADPTHCGPDQAPQACTEWVGTLGLRQDITYHPANNFWPLQWAEAGIFLASAALLAAFCFWWTRRRLA
jgi:hypothetical protein